MRRSMRMLVLGMLLLLLPEPGRSQPSGPSGNLPLPPETLRGRLQDDDFDIAAAKGAGGGVMGAEKLTLVFRDDGFRTDVKWKKAPNGGEGWNNSPRREIGAYAVQQLFLEPDDYVVPPVVARCIPLGVYHAVDQFALPNLEDAECVFGALSAWLQNVRQPDRILEPERFSNDPRYAHHFGNLNLLLYVILHKDTQPGNFLVSTDAFNPQMFSIDNGIAFGGVLFNFFHPHYNRLVVGGLPKQSVERLRQLTRTDLDRLGVLAELRADDNRVLRAVAPSANVDPPAPQRPVPNGIQLGLTTEEIDAIETRLQELFARIDRGEIATF